MNVNTTIIGGRYRVATYTDGRVATIYDTVRERSLVFSVSDLRLRNLEGAIEQLFVADEEKSNA